MPLVRLTDDEETAANLTPMIDVILVLTIFFMCATKFSADERTFDLDLPSADHAAAVAARQPEVVEVEGGGTLRLGTETVNIDELTGRLRARRTDVPDLVVMIRGARDVSHGRMTEVYEACRGAGVRHVAISVRGRGTR
jgi:biopolymer transport protein ExbD